MRVLVTDGETRAALAITRSLGRRGHDVVVGDTRDRSLAKASRYCRRQLRYPSPTSDEAGFVAALADAVRQERVDVLLPVTDVTTAIVSEQRDAFVGACRVPMGPKASISAAADKVGLLRLAERVGVAAPLTRYVESPDQVPPLSAFTYPVVVKPRRSRFKSGAGWVSGSVAYAADQGEVERLIAQAPLEAFPLILQERIEGEGIGVFLCIRDGRTVARFSHRRLRERPPSGGVSVLSESIAPAPLAIEAAERLLGTLQWSGVAMVEFKHDRRDGIPKLMEINPRFWGSLQLAIDAGVDFPAILVEDGVGPEQYRVGVRSRWFWGDVDALLLRLFDSRMSLPAGSPGRVRSAIEFLKFYQRDMRFDNPRADDVRPWLTESALWLRRLVSR